MVAMFVTGSGQTWMKLHCDAFSVVKNNNKYSYNVFTSMIDPFEMDPLYL
jgi:hypothetical protein